METAQNGILHVITPDIAEELQKDSELVQKWNKLTPIQRNEWICWITIVKKEETRLAHITRFLEQLNEGKKSPCCWQGCPHRNPNAKKWFKNLD